VELRVEGSIVFYFPMILNFERLAF
jgi:hypothetical protein